VLEAQTGHPAAHSFNDWIISPVPGLVPGGPGTGRGQVIRRPVTAQDPESNIFMAAPLDLAGGADPGAGAIQQHAQLVDVVHRHHPGLNVIPDREPPFVCTAAW
jgi:hypothetical protein